MRDHAYTLRRKAETIVQRGANYASHHSHPSMEGFRRQVLTDTEADATRLSQLADRAELRAARAAEGKLLYNERVEPGDTDFLHRFGGQRLLQLARLVPHSIVAE
jgi:hypothetical protein